MAAAGGDAHARLLSLGGGDKRNAIARDASAALLCADAAAAEAARAAVAARAAELAEEYGTLETGLAVAVEVGEPAGAEPLAPESTERLLSLLALLPHGALKYSHAIEGLVETSNNVASAHLSADGTSYELVTATRSSITPALERVRRTIKAAAERCGGTAVQPDFYPGWAPDTQSAVLSVVKEELAAITGETPEVKAIHAGLECGILKEKVATQCGAKLDCVSYGPTITGAHSPDERVQISTVAPFFTLTQAVLARLAQVRASS